MSYKQWAKRVQAYMAHVEKLFSPDLFIVGGGVSKDADKFLDKIKINAEMVPAKLLNTAGIVGAAWLADNRSSNPGLVMDPKTSMRVQ